MKIEYFLMKYYSYNILNYLKLLYLNQKFIYSLKISRYKKVKNKIYNNKSTKKINK